MGSLKTPRKNIIKRRKQMPQTAHEKKEVIKMLERWKVLLLKSECVRLCVI
jgi:hypothetical protein